MKQQFCQLTTKNESFFIYIFYMFLTRKRTFLISDHLICLQSIDKTIKLSQTAHEYYNTNLLTDTKKKMASDMYSQSLIIRLQNICLINNFNNSVLFPIISYWLNVNSHSGWKHVLQVEYTHAIDSYNFWYVKYSYRQICVKK